MNSVYREEDVVEIYKTRIKKAYALIDIAKAIEDITERIDKD